MNFRNVLPIFGLLGLFLFVSNNAWSQCASGLEISTTSGLTQIGVCPELPAELNVYRFKTSATPTPISFLVTDEENNILFTTGSTVIDLNTFDPGGVYRVWGFSYAGTITAAIGQNAAEVQLASVCSELTANFVEFAIYDDCFQLQVLHNSNGESKLLPDEDGIGGVGAFKRRLDGLRSQAFVDGFQSILLSSGDNFLPGPQFNANLELSEDEDLYDAIAINAFGYDAICLGNHDFDFGPDVLQRLIEDTAAPFLSANLDFSEELGLQALVEDNRIRERTVVFRGETPIGVFGLTTPNLPFITSPRNVKVDDDLVNIAQEQIDAFLAAGIDRVIMISHLQSINDELELATQLTGLDIIIAGGGDELLTNDPSIALNGQEVFGEYPLTTQDADGNNVYVVTTPGEYKYIGNLMVTFDPLGNVINISGNPVVVEADDPNQDLVDAVEAPVSEFVESLANTIIGITEVGLDGRRNSVRTMETNEGNLIADALLWQATELASEFGTPVPNVAIQNGGGIRNNNIIDAGTEISVLTTFNMLPFSNFVSVIEPLPAAQFKEILENAVSRVESVSGRFAQVAGCTVVYDPDGTPQSLDADGNVTTAGARIVSVTLADGTPIVANGELVASAPDITIATTDFLARGGDQYPYRGASFSVLGVSYQQALQNYIEDALAGEINIGNYPEGGEGRITTIGSGLQGLPQTTLGNTELAFELTAAPNPTTEELVVNYQVENAGQVQLYLSNTLGQRLATYVNATQDAGAQQQTIQLDVPAGTYFLTVNVNGKMSTLAVVKK